MTSVTHMQAATSLRHFIRVSDLNPTEIADLLDVAEAMKNDAFQVQPLSGESLAVVVDEPSASARVSLATAAAHLGATPIVFSSRELRLGRGEAPADTARSLSGYVSLIAIGTADHDVVDEVAEWASVPVVNAVSAAHHPCQALADALTIRELLGPLRGRRVAYVGDGRANVAHSLLEIGALMGLDVTIACPPEYEPDHQILGEARRLAHLSGADLQVVVHPRAAVAGADVVYMSAWATAESQAEGEQRRAILAPYRVTPELMRLAKPEAIFLHPLPATRDTEVSHDVIDGHQSAVWQQSSNRLPTAEALFLLLTRGVDPDG